MNVNVGQPQITNLAFGRGIAKKPHSELVRTLNGQPVDDVSHAVQLTAEAVIRHAQRIKPRATIPTGGSGGVDMVAEQIIR